MCMSLKTIRALTDVVKFFIIHVCILSRILLYWFLKLGMLVNFVKHFLTGFADTDRTSGSQLNQKRKRVLKNVLFDLCLLFADTDWCSVAVCDQLCNETSDGSSFTCSCRDGYILNDDMRTCRSELMHTCDDDDLCSYNGEYPLSETVQVTYNIDNCSSNWRAIAFCPCDVLSTWKAAWANTTVMGQHYYKYRVAIHSWILFQKCSLLAAVAPTAPQGTEGAVKKNASVTAVITCLTPTPVTSSVRLKDICSQSHCLLFLL